ncbi:MAG: histidine phosphatase family protein, partial [Nitrosopumilaceae archaeon]|nr:histidine phosphatase family protein [Nitrosopumilaceae archaeon]
MIIFLRHGQAKNNTERILAGRTPGIPLTEVGIKQAKSIAKYLKPLKIHTIYTSPVERALTTADIIAKNNLIDYKIDNR